MAETDFILSVAGLGVAVNCDDAGLAARLAQRYRAFSGTGSSLSARVGWSSSEHPFRHPDMSFRDGILYFDTPGYEGYVDVQRGAADLSLKSAHPMESVEYFLRVVYSLLAFRAGGLMVHAAGILHREHAYLFVGYSGSGKTTVARVSSTDHVILNDDLVILLPQGRGWVVYGTPFWNPTQVCPEAQSGGLRSVLFLVQDSHVYLESVKTGEALADLVTKIPVIPLNRDINSILLERLLKLLKVIPAYRLHFLPENSFWSAIDFV